MRQMDVHTAWESVPRLCRSARANRGLAGTGVAAVAEEPRRVPRGDGGQRRAARFVQRLRDARGDAAQLGLHLGPDRLDRVQIGRVGGQVARSEEHTSELQSRQYLVCRLLLEKKKKI